MEKSEIKIFDTQKFWNGILWATPRWHGQWQGSRREIKVLFLEFEKSAFKKPATEKTWKGNLRVATRRRAHPATGAYDARRAHTCSAQIKLEVCVSRARLKPISIGLYKLFLYSNTAGNHEWLLGAPATDNFGQVQHV